MFSKYADLKQNLKSALTPGGQGVDYNHPISAEHVNELTDDWKY